MLSRFSTCVLAIASCSLTAPALAESGHWSQQMDMSTQQTAAPNNRWQGNFPESTQAASSNPWASTSRASEPGVDTENAFVAPSGKKQFPELDYSPYEEGRKKIEARQSAATPVESKKQPVERPRANHLPNYQQPYYPGAVAPPYGGGYYPNPYGNYGYPWSGGGYPFSGGAPWGGGNNFPFFNGGSPWNSGSGFPMSPFNW